MKNKRFLALVCALALSLSLCTPAFAAGDTAVQDGTAQITVSTVLVVPTINVLVGANPTIVVNPYKMTYTNTTLGINGDNSTLMSSATPIVNKSTIGIEVSAKPTLTTQATVVTTGDNIADATTPTVFMFLELKSLTSTNVDTTTTPGTTIIKTDSDAPTWATTPGGDGTTVVLVNSAGAGGATGEAKLTMGAAADASNPTYAGLKISGETGGKGWDSTKHAVNVTVTLTFTPKIGTGSVTAP